MWLVVDVTQVVLLLNDQIHGHLPLQTTDVSVTEVVTQLVHLPTMHKRCFKLFHSTIKYKNTRVYFVPSPIRGGEILRLELLASSKWNIIMFII